MDSDRDSNREKIINIVNERRITTFEELIKISGMTREQIEMSFFPEYLIDYNDMKRQMRNNKK